MQNKILINVFKYEKEEREIKKKKNGNSYQNETFVWSVGNPLSITVIVI